MKLTDALLGEHGAFHALFDQVEAIASRAGTVAQIQTATAVLNALLISHANLEEELLFPALEAHLGENGPLAVMCAEHDEIELALNRIEDAQDIDEAADWVERALSLARSHFQKEEQVLFPIARQVLDDDTLTRLGKAWADARQLTIG